MDSQGLVQVGLYGTKFILQVGGTELFIVKRTDLQRKFIRLQRWPTDFMGVCDFKAFDKPWFRSENFGMIARNGCLAKIRRTLTREEMIKVFTDSLTTEGKETHGLLTEGFGRPVYITNKEGHILTGENYQPRQIFIKRNYTLELETIHLSKYGYIIHPTIERLLELLHQHAGILCDPFAVQESKKGRPTQIVHLPLI